MQQRISYSTWCTSLNKELVVARCCWRFWWFYSGFKSLNLYIFLTEVFFFFFCIFTSKNFFWFSLLCMYICHTDCGDTVTIIIIATMICFPTFYLVYLKKEFHCLVHFTKQYIFPVKRGNERLTKTRENTRKFQEFYFFCKRNS